MSIISEEVKLQIQIDIEIAKKRLEKYLKISKATEEKEMEIEFI